MAASMCNAVFRNAKYLSRRRIKYVQPKFFRLFSSVVTDASDTDVEKLFVRKDVRDILVRVTGFDLEKIFPVVPSSGKDQMKIELMTEEEVAKMTVSSNQRGMERLQNMPPFLKPRQEDVVVIADNPEVVGYEEHKLLFTDISLGLSDKDRSMVVREPDGQLRLAKPSERDRVLQIYFPKQGRSLHVPHMFDSEHLQRLLKEGEYVYVLERACVQFEPDDPKFIEVCKSTFDYIENKQHFDALRSTRHFGNLTFHLVVEKRIDSLLAYCVQQRRLSDAADIVRLFHIVYPNSKSAQASRNKKIADEEKLIQSYIDNDSRDPGPLEIALKVFMESKKN